MARQRRDAADSVGAGPSLPVSWPAREGFAWGGDGGLQGTSRAAKLDGVLLPAGIFNVAGKPPCRRCLNRVCC